MTEEQKEDIKLLKELIADTSIPNDDREIYQEALNQILAETKSDMPKSEEAKSDMPKVQKEKMPKKEKVTRKAKASPKTKAEKPTALPSDVEEMKKAIKERTGKTEAECEDIIAQYRKLRAKAKVNSAKRTEKLKSDDKLITGTNVITPVAQIEKDAEIVKEKIEKQVEQIENKAEREVVKKDKTKDEVKVEVEKKVVKQLSKLSDEMVTSATTFVKNIQTELKKVDKTEAKNFLLGLRNEIDALLSKFGDGGSTIETYNITENESASSVNPSLFARGGGVKANNNDVRVKALIKNLDNTPYSIGLAILRERLLTYTQNDLRIMEKNPSTFDNPIISRGMYKDYFNRVIEELKFDYEDGGSVDDGDFARGGGIGSSDKLYIFKVYNLNDKLVDKSRRIFARNLSEAKEIAILIQDEMHLKYGRDLRFRIEEAPSMMANGGGVFFNEDEINDIINKLRKIEIDGEKMQYILEQVGMSEQMLRQLIMTSPKEQIEDLLEEKIDLNKQNTKFKKDNSVDKFNIAYVDATGIYMGKPYDKWKLVTNILKKHNIEVDNSKEWGTKGYAEELYEDIDGETYYTFKFNINDSDNPELLKKQIENLPRQINWQFTTDDEYKKGGVTGKDNRAKKVIRNVNGFEKEFPIGDAWRKEHNSYNESQKYEIPKSSRKS